MNDDAIATLISGLRDRPGLQRLLRRLGFVQPLRRAARTAGTPAAVLTLSATRRTTLKAHVVTLRTAVDAELLRQLTRALRQRDGVAHHLLIAAEPGFRRVALAMDAPGAGLRHAVLEPGAVRAADVELLAELIAAAAEPDSGAAVRMTRALDRSRVTGRFFRDLVAVRDLVSRQWTGLPLRAQEERDALALLLLSRLLFLYFLQRRGVLDGDPHFLLRLLRAWQEQRHTRSFHRVQLRTLFFGVLNRRPAQRTARARQFGELPYLNGGLFELHRLEQARPDLDLSDAVVTRVFTDLLEKYRFTSSDAAEQEALAACGADVDPEMLGRIFEGLMPGERRGRTGTFYTPADVVDRVVCNALAQHVARRTGATEVAVTALLHGGSDVALPADRLHAIHDAAAALRVLDPACGSGAFLLGVMARLVRVRARFEPAGVASTAVQRDVVARALHGVDLLEDAALICSLRLWLALVPPRAATGDVPPLPNLDRRIRQGDALVDPLDIGVAVTGQPLDATAPPELRTLLGALAPAAAAYLGAGPESRPALRRELHRLEAALAHAWLDALTGRLEWDCRELQARAGDHDLFGEPAAHAAAARRRLDGAQRRLAELHAFRSDIGSSCRLPFFSFRVHFAEARDGFDLVLSNPPWVRAHNWPPTVRRLLRERYHVCAAAGWPYAARIGHGGAAGGSQVDLSLLFLERGLGLLNEHGTLAMLLPAKLLRSLYAGGARDLLLRHASLATIEDHSLDHRSVFDADAFTAVIIAHRTAAEAAAAPVHVTLRRGDGDTLQFAVDPSDLPLRSGDTHAPWLLVPPACGLALRVMQAAGTCIGEQLTIRRGVMTGANDVLVARTVEPKLGDTARIRTDGYYRAASRQGRSAFSAWVEGSGLRPALRGTDVGAWRAVVTRHVLWAPCNDDRAAAPLPRLERYLKRHRGRLDRPGHALGALQRLSPHTLGHKVVWSDLAADLRAAAVPARVRGVMGTQVPVVPLNTVYFIATSSADESMLLSAYLNSLPVRLFARAIAERAKDAHFRFFAWTIAVLPLPRDWRDNACARRLTALAHAAHARGGCTDRDRLELDRLVAHSYGLSDAQLGELAAFDAWLANDTTTLTLHQETHDARAAG